MLTLSKKMDILVIEDNQGDFILIEEYLKQEITELTIEHAKTFRSAKEIIQYSKFDVILLDLTLPDASGEELINETLELAGNAVLIVLTGYSNKNFSIKTLGMGVSDYLLKDELGPSQLFKSIAYSIERKKVNTELKNSEEKYRNLFISSPTPMWVYDPESFYFLDVNAAACRHYGYTREEFLSMTILNIRPIQDSLKVERIVTSNKISKAFYEGLFEHVKKNGELIYVNIQSNAIVFSEKDARIVIATDVTEKIKIQQERENLIFELFQNNEDLRQFSYITSHNLRGPIAQLLGLTSLFDSYITADPTLTKILSGIKQAARSFDETIRDLSKVLNVKDRPSIPREEVFFSETFDKIMSQCGSLIDESKANVKIDFSDAPSVNFNKAYIESILINLLTNSIKYCSKAIPLQISISTEDLGDKIILKFKDNGLGIDIKQHKEKIFGLYQRFHENTDGKGMGLFLIKSQMEALNGSIEVESEPNAGALFILQFKKQANYLATA